MDAVIAPEGSLEILSRVETSLLRDAGEGGLYELWRQCSLAVLNSGASDDDVLNNPRFDLNSSEGITDAVFHVLRNARVLRAHEEPRLVVCWGGHAIEREEYDYTKVVGYALGLQGLDICTGCGAGAMKGPMKGATVGHAKQRIHNGRYLGLTEPTIIAAESPNPIVNELVILPDMEKRLETFVRMAHAIVVFPGGVGTAEEVLYLLGILLSPVNADEALPVVFTGPSTSRHYFERLHAFIGATLGPVAQQRYKVILGDPGAVAAEVTRGLTEVRDRRAAADNAYFFNWALDIGLEFQKPFEATHESMRALELHRDQPAHNLAVNLRRAFSGIVAGNVREAGIARVEKYGPFELRGDPKIIAALGKLLEDFVTERRMRLSDPSAYVPCYRIVA